MSLRELYAKAWAQRRGLSPGWIVNLEPTYNLDLGAVGVVSGIDFLPETTLSQRSVTELAEDSLQQRSDSPWQFQSNDLIRVEIGSSGQTSGGAASVVVRPPEGQHQSEAPDGKSRSPSARRPVQASMGLRCGGADTLISASFGLLS
jgi:hypothetical protein